MMLMRDIGSYIPEAEAVNIKSFPSPFFADALTIRMGIIKEREYKRRIKFGIGIMLL